MTGQLENMRFETLISAPELRERVIELGRQISADYLNLQQPLLVVGVLKGSVVFVADLIREINLPLELEFIGVSSYEGSQSTGEVRITNDLSVELNNRHVLLVEDIIDTGNTIDYILDLFSVRKPASLRIATLLSKPECHSMAHKLDYIGFEIGKEFVVGYGLDYNQQYRGFAEIKQVIQQ